MIIFDRILALNQSQKLIIASYALPQGKSFLNKRNVIELESLGTHKEAQYLVIDYNKSARLPLISGLPSERNTVLLLFFLPTENTSSLLS